MKNDEKMASSKIQILIAIRQICDKHLCWIPALVPTDNIQDKDVWTSAQFPNGLRKLIVEYLYQESCKHLTD